MFNKLFVVLAIIGIAQSAPTISKLLSKNVQNKGSVNLLLTLNHGNTQQVLNTIEKQVYDSRGDKLTAIKDALMDAANKNQQNILTFLNKEKSEKTFVRPFWITNKIFIRGADAQLLEKLSSRDDILKIEQEQFFPLDRPTKVQTSSSKVDQGQWGINAIRAPQVWASGNKGQGAVVATVDTGVLLSHESLVGNYRADHGWYDPEGATATPNDGLGFGTHTMGIIAGQINGIGVAPDAEWVACKGCSDFECSSMSLLACGEWLLCPTDYQGLNANCSLAPHVVNYAWRGPPGSNFYDEALVALKAGGIVQVASVGKAGPGCQTVDYPGDSPYVLGVSGTTDNETWYDASSVGPTIDGRRKPDLSAPGKSIYSALGDADDSYALIDGTSRSSAHVAGLVGLMVSQNPELGVNEIQLKLQMGAVHIVPSGGLCGGINDNVYPNNHVGYGRADAVNSVFDV